MAEVEVRGLEEALRELRKLGDGALKVASRWAYSEAQEILALSKKIVPVDTGTLRSSGTVLKPSRSGGTVTVTVGYGGPAAPYALRVHEDLSARHREGQEAKYLEKAFLARERYFARTLMEEVRRVTRGTGGAGGSSGEGGA